MMSDTQVNSCDSLTNLHSQGNSVALKAQAAANVNSQYAAAAHPVNLPCLLAGFHFFWCLPRTSWLCTPLGFFVSRATSIPPQLKRTSITSVACVIAQQLNEAKLLAVDLVGYLLLNYFFV
jgi:hypothetical protein